jgi:hypothetical protein
MNLSNKNRNILIVVAVLVVWFLLEKLLASSNLVNLKTSYLNEESILIFNFFLLLFFLYRMVGETLGGFLNARHLAVKDEAQRALVIYKEAAVKLRNSYLLRRDLEELLSVSFTSIYRPYAEFRKAREPYLVSILLNQRTAFLLSTLYREEVYALGANYLRRFSLLKESLSQEVESELKNSSSSQQSEEEVLNILDR